MSGKVKLTREQADIIEKLKTEHLEMLKDMFENPQDYEIGKHEPLLELTAEKYHDALYIGYEVEESFEVGDAVVLRSGQVVEITEEGSDPCKVVIGWIVNGSMYRDEVRISFIARHATEQEKWWAKHGREVWELKDLDILINEKTGKMYEVNILADETIRLWKIGVVGAFASDYKSAKEISKYVEVFCFAEDRKDV